MKISICNGIDVEYMYGGKLSDGANEFKFGYYRVFLPRIKRSFYALIPEGKLPRKPPDSILGWQIDQYSLFQFGKRTRRGLYKLKVRVFDSNLADDPDFIKELKKVFKEKFEDFDHEIGLSDPSERSLLFRIYRRFVYRLILAKLRKEELSELHHIKDPIFEDELAYVSRSLVYSFGDYLLREESVYSGIYYKNKGLFRIPKLYNPRIFIKKSSVIMTSPKRTIKLDIGEPSLVVSVIYRDKRLARVYIVNGEEVKYSKIEKR